MASNREIAENVLKAIGGKDNVTNVTHCMTRLRFNLKDQGIPNDDEIKKIPGVMGIARSGGQYQIIIGQNVGKVYDETCALGGFVTAAAVDENLDSDRKKLTPASIGKAIIDYASGALTPLIPIMLGAAMFKTLMSIFGPDMLGLITAESNLSILFNFVYDAGFYFFPIYLGYTAAKKLNTSIPIAMFLGGILLAPAFMALANEGTPFSVYGIPCTPGNYASTVVPILLAVWVMKYVFGFFHKIVPSVLTTIFTPFLTVAVMLPITLCLLAPLGNMIGAYIAIFLDWLSNVGGFFAVGVIAALYLFLVMTGMHAPIVVLSITNLFATGSDSFLFVGGAAATWAACGMALGAFLKLKSKDEKTTAAGCFASVFLSGVTEPTLYGIGMKYKRPLLALAIGAFVGGCYAGLMKVTYHVLISPAVLGPLSFSAGGTANMIHGTIACVLALVITAVCVYFFGFSKEDLEADRANTEQ